ncbi:MAG: hypothetical protein RL839_15080 [Gammaproteobacteria bacterium]
MKTSIDLLPMGRLTALCSLALVFMLQFSLPASAQGVFAQSQTGVIQDLVGNGPGELTISGRVYTYDSEITEFTLKGEEVSDADLEIGMVVRFTIEDDILAQVQILGPNNLIENFNSH